MQSDKISPPGNSDELDSLIGKSLGQFRIVERIGSGGMATVFKAYQPTLDRYVAIKVLPAYHAQDPVFVKRFVQEARSVAKLAHPNIVQIHDFGPGEDDFTFIVMEYVDGGTLKDRLNTALPVPEAVDYVVQAAEGLNCAHLNGIVHRDVKPANMLLRKDRHLLLSDFGIAKILEGSMQLTHVGTGIGTPQYMSPEQGTGQAVDRRSDLYSLGIVLFHCLTGRVPFAADNPLSITIKHVNEPLPVAMLTAEGVPVPIIQVVQKMTEKKASDRYQSAEEVIDALTSALVASHLSMPRLYRASISPVAPPAETRPRSSKDTPYVDVPYSNPPGQSDPSSFGYDDKVTCFRCGALNVRSRRYCMSCGEELSNRRSARDMYLVNGRPVLARLTLQSGPLKGRSYRFHQDMTTIGRTNGNDFILSGRSVSRRHARLWFADGKWYLEDVGSSNGTLVNGARILQPTALNDGDVINFGDEIVVFGVTYGA
ncbi:MAG TPA: FHA domain-containing serine/threonine-protein kinase [Dictyobacter sp.]|jgi:serine/threonine protein kinase|nr:FHA domain-containing serine/threonine-protein kinase [Dictyobacter sp.]